MTINLTADQKVSLTAVVTDQYGNPVVLAGPVPVWSSDHPEFVTVAASADGFSADAITVGPVGSAAVSVSVTVDIGGSPVTLTASDDVVVAAGNPSIISVTASDPVAKA